VQFWRLHLETAIGVFDSYTRAEEAILELRERLPEDSLVFLTTHENDAARVSKVVGGIAGGATGLYAAIVVSLLVPGIGSVFALGAGAAAVLGLAGAKSGAALAKASAQEARAAEAKHSEDIAFFHKVLKEGRSLIVVRTESTELSSFACEILDHLGMGMQPKSADKMQTSIRKQGAAAIVDISGRITFGEGNVILRDKIRELLDAGNLQIVLNLREVQFVDSSGLGELVKAHVTVRNRGGQLTLVSLSSPVHSLLQLTRLSTVFEIAPDEESALRSLAG
jgi:anti-sigma B factor antagonist